MKTTKDTAAQKRQDFISFLEFEGGNIKTGGPFQVDEGTKLKIRADIKRNIGKILRIGFGDEHESVIDIGTLISFDEPAGALVIRSLKTGDLVAYSQDRTNSSFFTGTISFNKGVSNAGD